MESALIDLAEATAQCARTRVTNRADNGPVFADDAAHWEWLFGDGGDREGFVKNPKAALAEPVMGPQGRLQPGVEIGQADEAALHEAIRSFGGILGGAANDEPARFEPATKAMAQTSQPWY